MSRSRRPNKSRSLGCGAGCWLCDARVRREATRKLERQSLERDTRAQIEGA